MVKLGKLLRELWFLTLLGFVALSVLVIILGPHIAIAGHAPLLDWPTRILVVVILLMVWGMLQLLWMVRGQRKDEDMVEELARNAKETSGAGAEGELAGLSDKLTGAIDQLRTQARKGKLGRHFLYELPWYIIIGPPAAGKTTALRNSDLEFPLDTDKLQGVGGTLDCDWWFTNDAVLLDTAGRYTTQEYDEAATHTAWVGFLDLLKKHRPRRPINGIILAVSVDDLLDRPSDERERHARAMRARIHELYERLGVRFPVYLMFTKCDLVLGFTEFFDDLDRDHRNQVWGFTFPLQPDGRTLGQAFSEEYRLLLGQLGERLLGRLIDEDNEGSLNRRARVYGLPQQMVSIEPALAELVEQVFQADRYHEAPWLRGVYFTSGTQEGTPIDRLVISMFKQMGGVEGDPAGTAAAKGRSFFLTRFFTDVLFREAEISGVDPARERVRRWLQWGAYALAGLTILGGGVLWHQTYALQKQRAKEVDLLVDRASTAAEEFTGGRQNLASVLQVLNPLAKASALYADSPWYQVPLGLYRAVDLKSAVEGAYHRALDHYLTPVLVADLARQMRAAPTQPEFLYEALRVYLTFGSAERLHNLTEPEREGIVQWHRVAWEVDPRNDVETRQSLMRYLQDLLSLPPTSVTLDEALKEEVRSILKRTPLPQRAYWQIRDELQTATLPDWKLDNELGVEGRRVFTAKSGAQLDQSIPALYTYDGFTSLLLPSLEDSLARVVEAERNVMVEGQPPSTDSLARDVLTLYFQDYIRHWDDAVSAMQVVKFREIDQAVTVLKTLSHQDSPLVRVLAALESNTSLVTRQSQSEEGSDGTTPDLQAVGQLAGKAKPALARIERLRRTFGSSLGEREQAVPGAAVETSFQRLNELVRGEPPRPIDSYTQTLGAIGESLADIARALQVPGGDSFEYARAEAQKAVEGLRELRAAADEAPNPLKSWLTSIAQYTEDVLYRRGKAELDRDWSNDVFAPYGRSMEGRFPMARESTNDVKLADFTAFFGPTGALSTFARENLIALEEIRNEPDIPPRFEALGIKLTSYQQLRRAAIISAMFFPHGSAEPGVSFSLKAREMDERLKSATIHIGGEKLVYRHDVPRAQTFEWPIPDSSSVRVVLEGRDGRQITKRYEGVWSLFRMLGDAQVQALAPDEYLLILRLEGFDVVLELSAESVDNAFRGIQELHGFQCPEIL